MMWLVIAEESGRVNKVCGSINVAAAEGLDMVVAGYRCITVVSWFVSVSIIKH